MKMDCDIIKDLLPLYVEDMVSEKSKEAVDTHLSECEDCRKIYEEMIVPGPEVQFDTEPAKSFKKYIKKKKWSFGWKVALVSALIVLAAVIIRLIMVGGLISFLMLDSFLAPIEVDTDIAHYSQYMGENALEEYRNKWGMDESIFPSEITENMNVLDYKMVYYNPWDAQYLSYLVVEYDDEAYDLEIDRLNGCPFEEYTGIYGAKGFDEKYELLAMDSDSYQGFVYALTDGENRIIYVEIIFCNYYMDLDYEEYISAEYLPIGFDATDNNPYRKEMLKED